MKESRQGRIVWTRHHGPIPEGMEVDHINRNKKDNRLENLRLATRSENNCNRGRYRTNRTGEKNVAWIVRDQKYVVHVKKGEFRFRGYTRSFFSAVVAARLIRRLLHGEFATSDSFPTGS